MCFQSLIRRDTLSCPVRLCQVVSGCVRFLSGFCQVPVRFLSRSCQVAVQLCPLRSCHLADARRHATKGAFPSGLRSGEPQRPHNPPGASGAGRGRPSAKIWGCSSGGGARARSSFLLAARGTPVVLRGGCVGSQHQPADVALQHQPRRDAPRSGEKISFC